VKNIRLNFLLAFLLPLIIAGLSWAKPFVNMQEDGWYYLASAVNIANGKGYVDADLTPLTVRGPMMPLLMAASIRLGGSLTPEQAVLPVILVNYLGIVALALIGEKFIGKWVGVFAAAVTLAIPYLHDYLFSRLMTDGFQSSWILIGFLLLLQGAVTGRRRYWVATGFVWGIAFLAKESAILWLPLSFFIGLLNSDRVLPRDYLRNHLYFYLTFGITVLPWWVFLYLTTGQIYMAGRFADQLKQITPLLVKYGWIFLLLAISFLIAAWYWFQRIRKTQKFLLAAIQGWLFERKAWLGWTAVFLYVVATISPVNPTTVVNYIQFNVGEMFPYVPAFLAWIVFAIYQLRTRRLPGQFILITGLTHFPMFLILAKYGNAIRNLIPWMLFSILIFSIVVYLLLKALIEPAYPRLFQGSMLMLIGVVYGIGVFQAYTTVIGRDPSQQYRALAMDAANWLMKNVKEGEPVLATYYARREIFVLAQGKYPLLPIAPEEPKGWRSVTLQNGELKFTKSQPGEVPVVVQLANPSPFISNNYYVVYPSDIVNRLKETGAQYVIVSGDGRASPLGLSRFFYCWPYAKVLKSRIEPNQITGLFIFKIQTSAMEATSGCPSTSDPNTIKLIQEDVIRKYPSVDQYDILELLGTDIQFYPIRWQPFPAYLKLAELFSQHNNEIAARQAYNRAAQINRAGLLKTLRAKYWDGSAGKDELIAAGDILLGQGDSDDAKIFYDAALAQYPQSALVHYAYGQFLVAQGNFDESFEQFKLALELEPARLEYRLAMAEGYARKSSFDQSFAILNRLAEEYPGNIKVKEIHQRILASYFVAIGEVNRSVKVYNSLSQVQKSMVVDASRAVFLNLTDDLPNRHQVPAGSLVYKDIFVLNEQAKEILFMHAPSEKAFEVVVPRYASLNFSIALSPEVWNPALGDGVRFRVFLKVEDRTVVLYDRYYDPKNRPEDRHWESQSISLTPWTGKKVVLVFQTSPGARGNADYDWAGWGDVQISVPIQYNFIDNFRQALSTTSDFRLIRLDTMVVNDEQRDGIFLHPPNRVIFSAILPQDPLLDFGIALDPYVWNVNRGDGVVFSVTVALPGAEGEAYRVFEYTLDPRNHPDDRQWKDVRVDLARFSGQTVNLIFETSPGPNGNSDYDWAFWSHPVIISGVP